MNNRILAIIFSLFVLANNVFADKESDAFLANAAQVKYTGSFLPGVDTKITASYERKVFTIEVVLDGKSFDDFDPMANKGVSSVISSDDMLVVEALGLERMYEGFINNMIKSKAQLKRVVKMAASGRAYEQIMKTKQLKSINLADTANVDKMQLELQLRAINACLPMPMGQESFLNSLSVNDKAMVLELLLNEKNMTIEQVDEMKDVLEMVYVNTMKSSMFAKYVEQYAKAKLDLVIRMCGNISGKHTEITIPTSKAQELFDPDNQLDSLDLLVSTFAYVLKKKLPVKGNDNNILVNIKYADKTLSYISDMKGNEAKTVSDLNKINKLEYCVINNMVLDDNIIDNILKLGNIKLKYVYRSSEWDKDIVYEIGLREARDLNKEESKDSLNIAICAEMINLYRKKNDNIEEVHAFDGDVYTIHMLIHKKSLSPRDVFQYYSKLDFINILKTDYKNLAELLYRRKHNVRIHAKNLVTGKEETINIQYARLK